MAQDGIRMVPMWSQLVVPTACMMESAHMCFYIYACMYIYIEREGYIYIEREGYMSRLYHVSIANLMFLDSSLRGSMLNVQVGFRLLMSENFFVSNSYMQLCLQFHLQIICKPCLISNCTIEIATIAQPEKWFQFV